MGFWDGKDAAYESGKEEGRQGNSYSEACARIANEIAYNQDLRDAWEAGFRDGQEEREQEDSE